LYEFLSTFVGSNQTVWHKRTHNQAVLMDGLRIESMLQAASAAWRGHDESEDHVGRFGIGTWDSVRCDSDGI
jgi:hypothetical protein